MRKRNLGKYTVSVLCAALVMSSLAGCANNSSSEDASTSSEEDASESGADEDGDGESEAETTVYGQVSAVSEDSITIKVGTVKDMSGEETSADEDTEDADTSDDEAADEATGEAMDASSMLDFTGEEQTITLTDDTTYTSQSMGMGGGNGGQSMEMPDGEGGDGETMEMPDGEAPDGESMDGEAMEKPDGEEGDGESMEMPEGEDGETLEKPDGDEGDGESMEMPDGEAPDGESMDGEMGEAPDGDMGGQGMDDMSASQEISLSDISIGDIVMITLDDDGNAAEITLMSLTAGMGGDMSAMGDMGSMGGDMGGSSSSGVDSYTAVVEYTEDTTIAGETFSSTGTDENAIHIYENAIVSITEAVVSRLSSDSTGGDNSSFYGVGAAVLATSGTAYISDSTIETDAAGGAGVFAYGDAVVYVADTTITTEQDTSGGIHAAGGGTLYAWDLDVETNGESAAAIRSDRGGGTMVVDGGSYTSNGTGSPAVYCTADIAINDATLTANGSEAVCIEGLNSLYIFDSDLTGNMSDSSQNDCTWNIILYQSMSGDSEVGNSTFQMVGGSITANNGGMFYTTNTESTFVLSDVDITYADDNEFFLRCTGNNNARGWGSSGSNGADCTFTAIDQEMEGDVIWDSISELDFYMTDGSSLTGAFLQDETYAGNGGSGYANLYIDDDSTWTVTGDSVLSGLYCTGTVTDADGNTVSIVGSDGTVYVDGDSEYTVTVDEYSESVNLSGASEISDWSEYEVEKPDELG